MFTTGHEHGVKTDRECGEQQSTQCMFCEAHLIPFSKLLSEIHLLTYWFSVLKSARKDCSSPFSDPLIATETRR